MPKPWLAAVFAVTLAVYALLAPRIEARLDPVTGDEPFYMMTAHNILAGRGLDETVSWQQRDYLTEFYPPIPLPAGWHGWAAFPLDMPPHASAGTVPPGLYSKHGLGLAVLILPFYTLGKRAAIVAMLNLLGALLATNIFALAWEACGRLWPAVAAWLALSFSVPLMPYAFLIFPEIVAALATLYAFRRIRAPTNSGWQTGGLAAAIAILPWLHARFAVIAAALYIYWFWRHFWQAARLSRLSVLPLLLPVLSAAGLLDFYFYLYRSFLPNAGDHGGFSGLPGALNGAAGLLLDQQWGLLIAAPVYLLAIAAAIWLACRCRTAATGWALAVAGPYLALIAAYRVWWGEWCPPARYLVAVLPLLAGPLALALARLAAAAPLSRAFGFAAALPLAAAGWAEMAAFVHDPQLMYNQPVGASQLLLSVASRTGLDLTTLIPSYVRGGNTPLEIGWALAALALLAGGAWRLAALRPQAPEPARAPAALLSNGAVARISGSRH